MQQVFSGTDHRFERIWTRRQVNDAADRGEISHGCGVLDVRTRFQDWPDRS